MQTTAKLICGPAQSMAGIPDESVDLIVTSPPYPMVEMWDEIFALQDGRIGEQLSRGNGQPLSRSCTSCSMRFGWSAAAS